MKFTPEQQAESDRQKAANPAARHLKFTPTPEQAAELRSAAVSAESRKDEIEDEYHKLMAASEEEGFSGWLRRGIFRARRPIRKIAADAAIDLELLHAFQLGEATLPSDSVDRLVITLGLTLVEEPAR